MHDVIDHAPPIDELISGSGLRFPQYRHTDIAFACVVWQDADRLERLMRHVRPYFGTVAIAVQESTDRTSEVAATWGDIVRFDAHRGFGDASFGPLLLPEIRERWTFKVDVDEWPSEDLLQSLSLAVYAADRAGVEAVWIPFKSAVDGLYWDQDHSHLRLFHTSLGWPAKLHSRPPAYRGILWHTGFMDHTRSLDEMIQDYLRYYAVGRGNPGWEEHNTMMMREACRGTAAVKGWDYVKSFPWWRDVELICFGGQDPA